MKDISHESGMVEARFRMKYISTIKREVKPGVRPESPMDWPLEGPELIHEACHRAFRSNAPLFGTTPLEPPKLGRVAKRNLRVFWQELRLLIQTYGGWIAFFTKLFREAKKLKERRDEAP